MELFGRDQSLHNHKTHRMTSGTVLAMHSKPVDGTRKVAAFTAGRLARATQIFSIPEGGLCIGEQQSMCGAARQLKCALKPTLYDQARGRERRRINASVQL